MTANKKTFDDLEFKRHAVKADGVQARLGLGNDLELSVVAMKDKDQSFGGLYGNASKGTYEVAVFRNDDSTCVDTQMTGETMNVLSILHHQLRQVAVLY